MVVAGITEDGVPITCLAHLFARTWTGIQCLCYTQMSHYVFFLVIQGSLTNGMCNWRPLYGMQYSPVAIDLECTCYVELLIID